MQSTLERLTTLCLRLLLAVAVLTFNPTWADEQAPERSSGWAAKRPVTSKHDMVAAANPLAVDAGYRILAQGGSAVDAVIAVQMVLNLVDRYLADPDFVLPPPGLTDRVYLQARSQQIRVHDSAGRAEPGVPGMTSGAKRAAEFGADQALEFPSTSHISIVDRYGNAVAMTTTIEDAFGCRLMTRGGFLLNNELTDFSFSPDEDGKPVANRVEAGKRPRSSMAPTIVYDGGGRLFMVVGSPGGSAIINYVAKTLIGVLDWGLDPQAAIDLPNIGSRNGPTELEKDTSAAALEPKLQALGHGTLVVE